MKPLYIVTLVALSLASTKVFAQESENTQVAAVLDSLHSKASQADFVGYFELYTDDAVFLGTDATERWPIREFKDYTRLRFEQGDGWTYTMNSRNIFISPDGRTAWFDEELQNANLGLTRGTGVLQKIGKDWKIAQYNLTVPVPNEIVRDVVRQINDFNQ